MTRSYDHILRGDMKIENHVHSVKYYSVVELYLSRGADFVVVVVVEHPTPGLHHGALEAAGQSIGDGETPSWLLQSLPSLNTKKSFFCTLSDIFGGKTIWTLSPLFFFFLN